MKPTPTDRRPLKITKNWKLGHARRGRFLLQFDNWRRKFFTLQHALQQAGMRRCVYYRWKKGQVIPQERALRRYCRNTGIDLQYVLTGIPGKVGNNRLTLWHHQEQHKQATVEHERGLVFNRIVAESLSILQEEFPTLFVEGMAIRPAPVAIFRYIIPDSRSRDPEVSFYRYEIAIEPLSDGYVGFEVRRVEGGMPQMAMEGWCDEGALLLVRQHLRENTRQYLKKIKDDDVLTPFQKTEYKFTDRYNASHHQ